MTYQTAFPDFDMGADMDRLFSLGFKDASWNNDACPKVIKGRAEIYVDYGPEKHAELWDCNISEVPKERYSVFTLDADGCYDGSVPFDTASLDEAIAAAECINRQFGA